MEIFHVFVEVKHLVIEHFLLGFPWIWKDLIVFRKGIDWERSYHKLVSHLVGLGGWGSRIKGWLYSWISPSTRKVTRIISDLARPSWGRYFTCALIEVSLLHASSFSYAVKLVSWIFNRQSNVLALILDQVNFISIRWGFFSLGTSPILLRATTMIVVSRVNRQNI